MLKTRKDGYTSYWKIVRLMERAGDHLRSALRRWQAQRTATELEMLSDDVLRDIGITRAEIPAVALSVTAPTVSTTPKQRSDLRPAFAKEATT
jgi:uncharacterized protein YjiS (DUF1127 family)